MRELVDIDYPDVPIVRVVMDNLSTHLAGALYDAFPAPGAEAASVPPHPETRHRRPAQPMPRLPHRRQANHPRRGRASASCQEIWHTARANLLAITRVSFHQNLVFNLKGATKSQVPRLIKTG